MATNKVIFDGDVLVDLTGDTVTPNSLVKGATAHNAAGVEILGTLEPVTMTVATIPRGRMRGDVNGDGVIDSEDVTAISSYLGTTITDANRTETLTACDTNNDDRINSTDEGNIASVAAGISKPGHFAELTGAWTSNPDYETETAQFYCDIPVLGMTAQSSAVVSAAGNWDYCDHAECINGAVRIWARLCPPVALPCIISWGPGNGTAVVEAHADVEAFAQMIDKSKGTTVSKNIRASDWTQSGSRYRYNLAADVPSDTDVFVYFDEGGFEEEEDDVRAASLSVYRTGSKIVRLFCNGTVPQNIDVEIKMIPDGTGSTVNLLPQPYVTADDLSSFWSLSATAASLDGAIPYATIGVIGSNLGTITAVSDDTNVAVATVSGKNVIIRGKKAGTATVTITNSTTGTSKTVAVEVTGNIPSIYGVSWDGTSTTAWTRTDDAADFTDPVPYVAGATSYSSPFDNIMPWSGMVKVEDIEAGTMVAIPKFWYKLTQNGAGMKIQIANEAMDGFHVSPAHMDRGDGKGERDVVYIGRYHCAATTYKSTTGALPQVSMTRSTARTAIAALGSTIWQADVAMWFTIWLLYLVEFADWNSQAKIGYGCGNNSAVEAMGYTDSMPYHTGTTKSSRTTYGVSTQYRNIEGLWDNCADWMDGGYYRTAGMYINLNPATFADTSGGTLIGKPSSGYPSEFTVSNAAGFPMFYPSKAQGSDSTYSCDYWYFSASGPCLGVGGGYGQDPGCGLFYVGGSTTSNAYGSVGSRSMKLP